MGRFFQQLRLIMAVRFHMTKRRLCSAFCEIACPCILASLMVLLYVAIPRELRNSRVRTSYIQPAPVADLAWRMNTYNMKLAIAPSGSAIVNEFKTHLDTYYAGFNPLAVNPNALSVITAAAANMTNAQKQEFFGTTSDAAIGATVLAQFTIPKLTDKLLEFSSEAELETYVRSENYEDDTRGKVYAGIVFDSTATSATGDVQYTIRVNSSSVDDTKTMVSQFARFLDDCPQFEYSYWIPSLETFGGNDGDTACTSSLLTTVPGTLPGFSSLQLLVDSFLMNSVVTDTSLAYTCAADAYANKMGDGTLGVGNVLRGMLTGKSATSQTALKTFIATSLTGITNATYVAGGSLISSSNACADVTAGRAATAEAAMAGLLGQERLSVPKIDFAPFPVLGFEFTPIYDVLTAVFPLFFVLCLLVPVFFFIKSIVGEREMRLAEGLKQMGLSEMILPLSWFIVYWTEFLLIGVLVGAIYSSNLFSASDYGLVVCFFFLFGLASITFSYFVSAFFDRSRTAAVLGSVLYLASFFPYYSLSGDKSTGAKTAGSLLPATGFAIGIEMLSNFESNGVGLTYDTINVEYQNFTFNTIFLMFLLDAIVYFILGWYFERVWPHEVGIRRSPLFFIHAEYWCPTRTRRRAAEKEEAGRETGDVEMAARADGEGVEDDTVQKPSAELAALDNAENPQVIKITGLRKEFPTPDGIKVAVKGLNLTMYDSQCTVVLGHNGAGKTTTFSMLTGLIGPSSGTAKIYGLDIRKDMDELRDMMGVCPQHDVLYPNLTVLEHMRLYAGLKNVDAEGLEEEIAKKIAEVGLTEKVNALSKTLSGGQKRKLSVAIAFLGDSKVVILDEPTSGMDPYSQRSTWNIVRNNTRDRIILTTTHSMSEADVLGDRIAIMADGELKCCGSSLFLKKRYGVGYNLNVVKEPECKVREIKDIVKRAVPEYKLLSNVGTELSFQLPLASSGNFAGMLQQFDRQQQALGITTYGISVTTLEEVFLKVAAGEHLGKDRSDAIRRQSERMNSKDLSAANEQGTLSDKFDMDKLPERSMFFPHFAALMVKRFHNARRDFKMFIFQIVVPCVALAFGALLLRSGAPTDSPALGMDVSLYNPTVGNQYERSTRMPSLKSNRTHTAMSASIFNTYGFEGPSGQWPYQKSFVLDASTLATDNVCRYLLAEPTCKLPVEAKCDVSKTVSDSPAAVTFGTGAICDPASYTDMKVNSRLSSAGPRNNADNRLSDAAIISTWLIERKDANKDSPYGAMYWRDARAAQRRMYPTVMWNTSSPHAPGVFLNTANNVAMDALRANGASPLAGNIRTDNHPLPLTYVQKNVNQSLAAFTIALFLALAFAFIPASQAVFVVKEREVSVKHQQLISGVSIPAYWISTFVWDVAQYLITWAICIAIIFIFEVESFTKSENLGAVLVLFLGYGIAAPAFTYITSFAFSSHTNALNITLLVNFMVSIMLTAAWVMQFFTATCKTIDTLLYIFQLMPGFAFGWGLIKIAAKPALLQVRRACYPDDTSVPADPSTFHIAVAGTALLYLFLSGVAYLGLAILYDISLSYPVIKRRLTPKTVIQDPEYEQDDDVDREAARVAAGEADTDDDLIVVDNLRRIYGSGSSAKVAVRSVSFSVPAGQCMGMCGINGAGKTSTFKMLTGDLLSTTGSARLLGLDVEQDQIKVRRKLGYCPQFSALLDLLTVREHLELFARIKGFSGDLLEDLVQNQMTELGIAEFENKLAGTLSGGNKRKLSVAIALLGNPRLLFLDEPSTGVDPVSRRKMWDVISRVCNIRKKMAIILTSHSMEEVEALCNRVTIMVGGRLRCIGTIQHLRNKFGKGFQSEIRLAPAEASDVTNTTNTLDRENLQRVAHGDIDKACSVLGLAARAKEFSPVGSAWTLLSGIQRDGSISSKRFAEWWEGENVAANTLNAIGAAFKGAVVLERHSDHVRLRLPRMEGVPLSEMFGRLERIKQEYNLQEHSLSQTSLEQVFNEFARQQEEETGDVAGFAAEDAVVNSSDVRTTASGSGSSPPTGSGSKTQVLPSGE